METRDRLHALVDTLPDNEVHVALRFLEFLENSLWSLADAPLDDEPLSLQDERALDEAEEDLAHGRVVSHEEARRRLLGEH
ncbi:MAG TPA: hypothetical protein VLS89_20390 [Candidatus Nanopelagicales bacterium]|nr:hypothetical protein [Candidatus Nanopelagicales bacterium]